MHCLTYVLCLVFVGRVVSVDWDTPTPLDDYVNRDDPHYTYEVLAVYDDDPDITVHVLNMTSQKWLDESFSEDPIWWHYLSIFIPKATEGVITDAAFLHIGNGNHTESIPTMDQSWMKRIGDYSRNMKVVTAYLKCVPYQPIRFPDNLVGRVEDFIIGHTWRVFIEDPSDTPNPDVVVLLPMVKAAKKAVDTIVTFAADQDPKYQITKFMPSGFSKRGWTTWLLGSVDRRAFAIAPTVFDLLNMQDNLEHHNRALGGWSWAFFPYWFEDVSKYLYHPRVPVMASFIDPLSYVERLTMPKLLIAASGDEFFPPTGTHYFWDKLLGEKYFQIWENDSHSLSGHLDRRDATIQAFFLSVYNNIPRPRISWVLQQNEDAARISVTTSVRPETIQSWMADTTEVTCEPDSETGICRRDFRLRAAESETNTTWDSGSVLDLGLGQYFVAYEKPSFGYRGFFIQMTYPGPGGFEMTFTTEVNVIPDNFPYPKCESEEECKGSAISLSDDKTIRLAAHNE